MQKFYFILVLILTFSCSQKQSDNRITEFEKVLGERQTKALNSLVSDFEKNLTKVYSDLPTEKAYRQYLTDLISNSTTDWEKFKFQSYKTNTEFHQSGLWSEIYTKDSVSGLQVNGIGKYMQALYIVKDSDSLIKKYWEKREAAGMMQNELVIPGILSLNPDFNNYFHKRIVVVEFSF
ncbi:hypothetical protein CJ739_2527 [Mariniflexile rhizosphaerae]|uniref:hypothetical protein n=1 Tax=unclassified Mariniflexile TaxID=2643887 RepID=UPI000CB5B9DB|nr:hypothetical protein [Mariniflexile sp. TRM1-10]AXP81600.1 hypothetical protein CJ739_2527 [Mariniflexile sp. TRM1-10]PLB17585.1 MAG: hypothetical protein TRG1_3572 [Flavobacteriaceae bacterium FS1-H7996/R]